MTDTDDDIDPDIDTNEPQEGDLTTEDHRTFYRVGGPRRGPVLVIGEDENMKTALRAFMEREKFWPDVWWISDHGNAHRIDMNPRDKRGRFQS